MAVDWFYLRAGQVVGPLTAAQLREHSLSDEVAPSDHVRRNDGDWVLAAKVKGLFDAVPPASPQTIAPKRLPLPESLVAPKKVSRQVPQHNPEPRLPQAIAARGSSVPIGWVIAAVAGLVAIVAVIGIFSMSRLSGPNNDSSGGGRGGSSGSKLTADNFLKIKPGMNHQDVTLILGQPTKKEGSTEIGVRLWTWTEGSKEICVIIDNGGNVDAKTQTGLN